MNTEVLNLVVDMIFSGFMPYIAPIIFGFVVLAFSDRLIELLVTVFRQGS